MKFRAICTDIDGTLLNSERQLSQRTIHTFRNLDKDVPVILASSRMPSAMRHLQQQLEILHHPLICFNGGYVIHFEGGKTEPLQLDSVQIQPALCQVIHDFTKETDIHVSLYEQDNWYAPAFDFWAEREERVTKVSPQIAELELILEKWHQAETGAHKVMCMGPADEIDALEQKLSSHYADQVHAYRSKDTYLEIAPRAISKATALELLLKERFGIAMHEVMAFGDNYNDIHMLQEVGMGIAVANARDEVKAVANEITLKSTEDGVAVAIEKYWK
ncbi:Cof-type HAD-IIB family hydrolase [Pontibacter anaerobius]|uniref:Cof-type HAD-IIB family hydrolase n=1 Tax=Pontibacter anaerobius TaxID=2993940 RepID=A0ABT3R9D0_9BACT|nr:Cof-type HAD-IIB family hydrolase [Pontibacter anaerobius]MCX2738347.1 Cof-type HAD-IIB family hydrolase [Pontibacter anaerobius]